jgi:YaaC-like Protein
MIPMIEHRSILTQQPEEEIWHYVSKLASRQHVKRLLTKRISEDRIIERTKSLQKEKQEYNNNLLRNHEQKTSLEVYDLLPQEQVDVNTEEICITVKQAMELYNASKNVTMYAKPIILYYCYTKLARILFLSTYGLNFEPQRGTRTHGLTLKDNDVMCLRVGAFVRFYDSFSVNPSIYIDNATFDWTNILSCSSTQRYYLFENMRDDNIDNFVSIKDKRNNKTYSMHELTRELLFTYALSMLARYAVKKWKSIIESEESDIIWKIEGYLKSTQSFFPNLILNELHGKKFFFYAESRASPDKPEFEI